MKRISIYLILLSVQLSILHAQTAEIPAVPVSRMLVGVGHTDVLDTYLSPYSYDGIRLDLVFDKRYTHTLHRFELHGSATENPAGNVNEYEGGVAYSVAHLYALWSAERFSISAGPMGTVYAGCIYNERNGNNPAQAKLSLLSKCAAVARYGFDWLNRTFTIEYMAELPILGLAYSPQFGQSYYEEFSLGNYDHNCVFAHTLNTPSFTHHLLLEVPLRKSAIYFGYKGVTDQSKYNHLRYHSYNHSLLIGLKL